MTDRELLELAAKAAGLHVMGADTSSRIVHGVPVFMGLTIRRDDYPSGYRWNPLTDDGDALRLAVKIGRSRTLQLVVGVGGADCQFDHPLVTAFESGDDPYAATRRAIVRAAAEIGRTM